VNLKFIHGIYSARKIVSRSSHDLLRKRVGSGNMRDKNFLHLTRTQSVQIFLSEYFAASEVTNTASDAVIENELD
jgi:hypothetical protein